MLCAFANISRPLSLFKKVIMCPSCMYIESASLGVAHDTGDEEVDPVTKDSVVTTTISKGS